MFSHAFLTTIGSTPLVIFEYWQQLLYGVLKTLEVFAASWAGVVLIGLAGALASLARAPWIPVVLRIYTTVFRSVPELIIILATFLGISVIASAVLRHMGWGQYYEPNVFISGVMALSLTFGAYAVEIFRSALSAVPRGDIDAAYSIGMRRNQVYFRIVLPQMLRFALPGMGNLTLVVLKDTALLSVIGVNELMRTTKTAISYTREPFTFYLGAAIIYLVLTSAGLWLLRRLERHALRGWPSTGKNHDVF
jgi:polar amino acid transport system permease protein